MKRTYSLLFSHFIYAPKLILFCLIFNFALSTGSSGQLMINEFAPGGTEFIELVVIGAPCELVNIQGIIIDDNNGDFVNCTSPQALSGTGVAAGFIRFTFDPIWAAVPAGTIIVIGGDGALDTDFCDYTMTLTSSGSVGLLEEPQATGSIPVTPIGAMSGNCAIQQDCALNNGNASYSTGNPFGPITSNEFGGSIKMKDDGDACQLRTPSGVYLHGLAYGSADDDIVCPFVVALTGGPDNLLLPSGPNQYSFINSNNNDFSDINNWTGLGATPGQANTCENAQWIASMRGPQEVEIQGGFSCNTVDPNTITLCGPETISLTDCPSDQFSWTSDNPSVAGFSSPTNGSSVTVVPTPNGPGGTANITVTITLNNSNLGGNCPAPSTATYTYPVNVASFTPDATSVDICQNQTCYNPYTDNNNIYSGGGVTFNWFNGDPDAGGTLLSNPPSPCLDFSAPPIPQLFVTISDGSCASTFPITVNAAGGPTVNIPPNVEICRNDLSFNLNNLNAIINPDPGANFQWYNGNPNTGGSSIGFTFAASPANLGDLWVIVTLNGCTSDPVMIPTTFIQPSVMPTSDVNNVCAGGSVNIMANATDNTGVMWNNNGGDGSFGNPNIPNTTYTPGPLDILAGNVRLTVTTISDCNVEGEDFIIINIVPGPTANITGDNSICGNASASLNAGSTDPTNMVSWTTVIPSDGNFSASNNNITTYTPGPNDIANGSANVTVTISDANGLCFGNPDIFNITILPAPTAMIDIPNPIVCEGEEIPVSVNTNDPANTVFWSTNGDGNFLDRFNSNTTYTPGPQDGNAGVVRIAITVSSPSGCPPTPASTDIMVVPIMDIMADGTPSICSGSGDNISLGVSLSDPGAIPNWSSPGDGTFNPNNNVVNPTYTPGPTDISTGSITFTVTASDPSGNCPDPVTDTHTTIIEAGATVVAGNYPPICEGSDVLLDAILSNPANTILWSTSGDGAFSPNNTVINPTYIPGPTDIINGLVMLTTTTESTNPNCTGSGMDQTEITITASPSIMVSNDNTICASTTAPVEAIIGGSATAFTWSTSGDGTFTPNNTDPNATYTPGADDLNNSFVTITATTDNPNANCTPAVGTIQIFINQAPEVTGLNDETICEDGVVNLNAMLQGSATSLTWTTSGDGTFSPTDMDPNATYTPGTNDLVNLATPITLTATTDDVNGTCPPGTASLTVTLDEAPSINLGNDLTSCGSDDVNLLAPMMAGSASTVLWTTSGDGNFDDDELINPVYSPGDGDIATGSVTLFAVTDNGGGICNSASDELIITFSTTGNASFVYPEIGCTNSGSNPVPSTPPTSSGSFSVNNGGDINATTGEFIISSASIGETYIITFTGTGSCPGDFEQDITVVGPDDSSFGYPAIICVDGPNPAPTSTLDVPGIFTVDGVASIDAMTGELDLSTVTAGDSYLISFTTTGDCPATTATNISILAAPDAGDPMAPIATCNMGSAIIDLDDLLNDADAGGTWTDVSTNPTDGFNVNTFDPNNQAGDTYTFRYTLAANAACPENFSEVDITVEAQETAILDQEMLMPCSDNNGSNISTVNLNDLVLFTSATGTWEDTDMTGVNLSDLNNVDFNGIATGSYTFTYMLPTTANCPQPPTYTTVIEVVSCNCPASENSFSTTICESFIWNSIEYTVSGTYTQNFPGAAASGCDSSDVITLTVIPAPTIDVGGNFITCEGDEINLNATFGGSATGVSWSTAGDGFFDNENIPNSIYTPGPDDIANRSVTFIGETVNNGCNAVTDNVIVNMLSPQDASFDYPDNACLGSIDPQPSTAPTPSGTYTVDNGASIDPITGVLDLDMTSAGQSYEITYTSDGTCPGTATQIINIVDTPNAGTPNTPANVCNENGNIIDLNSLLNGEDVGGTWTEVSTTPSTGLSGNQFDANNQNPGTYTFRYTVSNANCPDDFTDLTVNIDEPFTATLTISTSICNNNDSGNSSIFNFNNLITNGNINGTWTDTDLTGVDLNDLTNVSFDGIAADNYTFTYTTPANGDCPGQDFTTTILVEDCLCPSIIGDPVTYDGCQDDGFEISVNGMLYNQTNPTGIENFTSFNTGCDSIVDVNLVFATPPNAGTAAMPVAVCNDGGNIINLNSLLTGADVGGTWTETSITPSTGLNGNQFDPNGQNIGIYTFDYTVLSGNACPDDFVEVSINVSAGNAATLEPLTLTCNSTVNGNITNIDFNTLILAGDAMGSWTDTELTGIDLSNLSNVDFAGISTGTYTFTYSTSSAGNCPGQDYTIEILVRDCDCVGSEETITYAGCTGDGFSTLVNGNVYDENNQTGTEIMLSQVNCDSIVIIDLNFSPAPTIEAGDDRFICVGDPVDLTAMLGGAATMVTWSSTGTGSFDNDQSLNPTYTPGQSDIDNGFVSLIVLTNNGGTTCPPATDIITLNFVTALTGSISGESTICAGASAEISFDLNGGTLYNISISDGTNTFTESGIPDGFTAMVSPTTTTTYTLESLTAIDNSCLATIPNSSITITVGELSTSAAVTSSFDGFGVSCNGSSDGEITVTPTLGTAPFNYVWSNGSTSSVADNLSAGSYTVTVTDATGCAEEISATITEPSPINLTFSTIEPECFGDNNGVISIDTITGGNGPYLYSVGELPLQVVGGFPVLTPFLAAGNYEVTLQDSEGCETTSSVNIDAPIEYVADLGRDTTILLGDSIELEVFFNFDPDSILWSATFDDACVSCTAQYVMPESTSGYTIYAADSTGCSTTTEILVMVDKPRRIYIPNGFSPNGDGINDVFFVSASTEVDRITKFSVFDRWGEIVFNADNTFANDPRSGWNGDLKNKALNSAVFIYVIEVLFVDGERKLYSGDVTLVR